VGIFRGSQWEPSILILLLILLLLFVSDTAEKGRPLLTMAGVFDVWKSKSVRISDAV